MASLPARRIAVCVDDFGLHEGVNGAALALAAQRRVTAVSCMVGAPAWRAGAASLAGLDPQDTDVGLHLDLTEHPITARRSSLPLLMTLSVARVIDRAGLRSEIDAQLEAFEQAVGRPPAHVDGHQHVHQFPLVREALLDALLERYPRRRPWIRRTKRPPQLAGSKPWLIERLGCDRLSALAREQGFAQNAHLLGVYDFRGDAGRYRALLAQWLGAARDGDLLMCHPALQAQAPDPIIAARRNEYAVLSSAAFGDLLAGAAFETAPLSRWRPRG